jgi:hypothetical protein
MGRSSPKRIIDMAKAPRTNKVEQRMARNLDKLAQFERYETEIGGVLRDAIAKGLTPDEMRKNPKILALIEARKITIALTDPDSSRAMAAIKDTLDRVEGKAKERSEVEHRYGGLKETELDALLLSQLADEADSKEKH